MPRKPRFKLTPPEPNEDQLQKSVADLLDWLLPEEKAIYSHFPAGGYFLSPAARARLFRLGLKPGFPDIIICYGIGRVLWIEMKTSKGVLSLVQRKKRAQLGVLGFSVVTCRRVEDVVQALIEHDVPFHKARLAA